LGSASDFICRRQRIRPSISGQRRDKIARILSVDQALQDSHADEATP
jgi:hypothetical protein